MLVGALGALAMYLFAHKKSEPNAPALTANDGAVHELRLSGSNTIGEKLAPELVTAWFATKNPSAMKAEANVGDAASNSRTLSANINGEVFRVSIQTNDSSTAFEDLASQRSDIAMASRQIKPEEKAALARLGDMQSAASEHPIALDGIAVIVAPNNPRTVFTKKELQQIFCGNAPMQNLIHAYAREPQSGTYDTFQAVICDGATLSPNLTHIESSSALEARVAKDPMAIGFVSLPYVKTAKTIALADDTAAQPFLPTVLTVKKEDYVLARRLYFYTPEKASNPIVMDFMNFVESEAGQKIVSSVGFIDFNIANSAMTSANMPCALSEKWTQSDRNAYCDLREKNRDSGVTFRFKEGTAELDTRGAQDTKRLLAALNQDQSNAKITLIGFADSTGDYAQNINLSQQRAESIGKALRVLGFEPNILRFGAELPVRSNDNARGREANRRVEVWLPK